MKLRNNNQLKCTGVQNISSSFEGHTSFPHDINTGVCDNAQRCVFFLDGSNTFEVIKGKQLAPEKFIRLPFATERNKIRQLPLKGLLHF